MRAKTYAFECQPHEEYGSNGWKLIGNPNADPLSGMAVAHDVLEHPPNGDMGVEDELMALGASIYVRVFTRNMHSLGANVGSDLPDIMRHVWYEGMTLRDPGRTTATAIESEIDDALEVVRKETEYDADLRSNWDAETEARIRGWMRKGYRAAIRRWAGVNTRSLFDEIETDADRHLKHAEIGDKLYIRITFERSIVTDSRRVSVKTWLTSPWEG